MPAQATNRSTTSFSHHRGIWTRLRASCAQWRGPAIKHYEPRANVARSSSSQFVILFVILSRDFATRSLREELIAPGAASDCPTPLRRGRASPGRESRADLGQQLVELVGLGDE